jgi:hypothetical protein
MVARAPRGQSAGPDAGGMAESIAVGLCLRPSIGPSGPTINVESTRDGPPAGIEYHATSRGARWEGDHNFLTVLGRPGSFPGPPGTRRRMMEGLAEEGNCIRPG